MADNEYCSPWKPRIHAATKVRDEWANKFKCKLLWDYYEGFQWKQRRDYPTVNYNPYTINLVFSTIKIKLASLLFQKPKFLLSPNPGNSQWNLDFAVQSAQLKENILNTLITNPNMNFAKQIKRAARDSFFRFGIIETGYASDWRNPQKVDAQLKSWEDTDISDDDDDIVEDNPVPMNERFYIKRIKPTRFVTSVSEAIDLKDHDWYGYCDYYYTRNLMNDKSLDWPKGYSGANVSAEYTSGYIGSLDNEDTLRTMYQNGSVSLCWHIWDNVAHKRLLLLEDDNMHELWSGDFDTSGFVDIRWDERDSGFYPIPPVFHWLSPQDEINEAREQTRSYRRRFTRKFQSVKDAITEEEKEKFASGPDGIIIEVKQADAIKAIDNPEIGPTSDNALLIAKDDFNIISGTSSEVRGSSDRETATQSKIIDTRSQIRESAEQMDFSTFLCLVGRELLVQCQSRLVEGLWVKMTANPNTPPDPRGLPVYQYVTSQQIDDGYDYEIEFDVQNATPAAMAAAQQAFVNFMALLTNFPMISMSPTLIREAAYRVGYRNEEVIKQVQQAALMQAQMQAQQIANQPPPGVGGGANPAKAQAAQMQSPNLQTIEKQVTQQLQ